MSEPERIRVELLAPILDDSFLQDSSENTGDVICFGRRQRVLEAAARISFDSLRTIENIYGVFPEVASPLGDLSSLTKREKGILELAASGMSNPHIAKHLWISEQTVKFHLNNVYRKLGVANRTEASSLVEISPEKITPVQSKSWQQLTRRQKEIANCIASGETDAQIAIRLGITKETVKFHVHNVLVNTGTKNRTELACLTRFMHGSVNEVSKTVQQNLKDLFLIASLHLKELTFEQST